MSALAERAVQTAVDLTRHAHDKRWRGPDAYDGLWHDWPKPLVGGRRRRQVLMQIHARSPVDVRGLYRREHPLIPKALGIFGSVGVRAHLAGRNEEVLALAADAMEVLDADRTAGEHAWGYHWDMQTRWSFYPAGSPNVVVTAFCAAGLLEAAAALDRPAWTHRAREAARWAADELWVEPEGFFAYHPGSRVNIHNANLLGAWLVHVGLGDDGGAKERVARAVERTLGDQRPDGTWGYGEGGNLGWVDSFHTGYVLQALLRLRDLDPAVEDAVARGASPYMAFFDHAGRATLWADRRYPEDAHSAGTGLSTLALLMRHGLAEQTTLERVADRTLSAGIRDGRAVWRRYRWGSTRATFMRWCDAHVALGLVDAALALAGRDDPAPPQAPDALRA